MKHGDPPTAHFGRGGGEPGGGDDRGGGGRRRRGGTTRGRHAILRQGETESKMEAPRCSPTAG